MEREEFIKLLEQLRRDDTLVVSSLSRLGRKTKELITLIDDFNSKGVNLVSLKENMEKDYNFDVQKLHQWELAQSSTAIKDFIYDEIKGVAKDALTSDIPVLKWVFKGMDLTKAILKNKPNFQ